MKRRLLLVILVTAACAPEKEASSPPVDDERLMLALSQAKNHHHTADVYLADGNTEAAIQSVSSILRIPFPPGAKEGQDALLDARARLGKLYLGAGKLDEAQRVVEEGLAAPSQESFFLANLWTVSGEVHQARSKELDVTNPAAAKEARRKAIESYSKSIEIAERIQKQLYKEVTP
jgi:tetratricopeptide (TPR) repeat protein